MNKTTNYFIIAFCYAYIVGVTLDMIFPAFLGMGSALWFIAAGSIALTGMFTLAIALGLMRFRAWYVVLALLAAVLFGYARHLSVDTNPDIKAAKISFNGAKNYAQQIDLKESFRLKIVKTFANKEDFKVKLAGKLYARTIDNSKNLVDQKGRWRFMIEEAALTSRYVTVKASDPIGTSYKVSSPFNTISNVELDSKKTQGQIEIWQISNHAKSFARAGLFRPAITVLGQITQDPQVRESKTVLSVTPEYIQYVDYGPFYKVDGGDVQVMLYPNTSKYQELAQTAAYGYQVRCTGELRQPQKAANPGDFDFQRYMYNHNYAGGMSLQRFNGIEAIKYDGNGYAKGNWLVELSLDLRDKMLAVIKQTMPMPHSAFVGAVTLGLRYGLAEAPSFFGDYYEKRQKGISKAEYFNLDTVHEGSESLIAQDFKRAGVNHVLAVSGLHVTIITAMFIGICSIIKIPRKMFVPPVILALIIFAIITGARPSTLRAVIMNSLFLLTWAYLARGLRSAALFGVAVSGFLILIHNPLMLVDPSFTLSFGAILSLVLLTQPCQNVLSHLKGNLFIVFWIFLSITTILGISHFGLYLQLNFMLPYLMFWTLIGFIAYKLQPIFHPIGNIGYNDLPKVFSNFFAAQFAIQIGMMLPLSAYYFGQWPFGGAYANLIAIPLIGVIVQLGVIAGLLGLIPGAGIFLALVLNAANWVCSWLFLYISHVIAHTFPYPFLPRPSTWGLLFYYLICFTIVYYLPWSKGISKVLNKFGLNQKWHSAATIAAIFIILALPFLGGKDTNKLKITMLSVRYGSAIVIETPNDAKILLDASAITRGAKTFNTAERTVIPYLSRLGAFKIDAAVITSPNIQRAAGMTEVLHYLYVKKLFVPQSIYGIDSNMEFDSFKDYILNNKSDDGPDDYRFQNMYRELVNDYRWPHRRSLLKVMHNRQPTLLNKLAGYVPEVCVLKAGEIIWQETDHKGLDFTISVIHPDKRQFNQKNLENRSTVIKITYGDFSMILPSDLHFLGQEHLKLAHSAEELNCSVFVIPGHGAQLPAGEYNKLDRTLEREINRNLLPLIKKTKAETLVVEYGDPRYTCPKNYREMRTAYGITMRNLEKNLPSKRLLSTDKDQAITITSDGVNFKVTTQVEKYAAAGQSNSEGTSDIGYGF